MGLGILVLTQTQREAQAFNHRVRGAIEQTNVIAFSGPPHILLP